MIADRVQSTGVPYVGRGLLVPDFSKEIGSTRLMVRQFKCIQPVED